MSVAVDFDEPDLPQALLAEADEQVRDIWARVNLCQVPEVFGERPTMPCVAQAWPVLTEAPQEDIRATAWSRAMSLRESQVPTVVPPPVVIPQPAALPVVSEEGQS
jgi:hypothetical protein